MCVTLVTHRLENYLHLQGLHLQPPPHFLQVGFSLHLLHSFSIGTFFCGSPNWLVEGGDRFKCLVIILK